MTFEQMQALLAQVVQAQAQAQVEMAEMRASIAKLEQNLAKLEQNVTKLQENLARTEAIANSNARAIEAVANQQMVSRQLQDERYQQTQAQLAEFIRTVAQFVSSTETRLRLLENK